MNYTIGDSFVVTDELSLRRFGGGSSSDASDQPESDISQPLNHYVEIREHW